jgi:hypothetical protein
MDVAMRALAEATSKHLGQRLVVDTGWRELVDAGKLRLLVTWGAQRTKRSPNAPTLKEAGYNIVSASPYGIAGRNALLRSSHRAAGRHKIHFAATHMISTSVSGEPSSA